MRALVPKCLAFFVMENTLDFFVLDHIKYQ